MPTAMVPSGFVDVFGARIRVLQFVIIGLSIVLMGVLTYIVKSTRIGKAMRATSQDMEAAEMMGIDTNRTISFTFIIGSALAAIGGFMVAIYYGSLQFDTGFLYGLKAFTAAVLGGIGNIPGAVVGSLILGLAENCGVGLDAWVAGVDLRRRAGRRACTSSSSARRRSACGHIARGRGARPNTSARSRGIYRLARSPTPAGPSSASAPMRWLSVSASHALRLIGGQSRSSRSPRSCSSSTATYSSPRSGSTSISFAVLDGSS